jgi:two-component system OmpR family response regulator
LQAALRPSEGLALLGGGGFEAVILEVMLSERDGFEVCRRHWQGSDISVLMLTARDKLSDRVELELGADDDLRRPFEPRELAVRLQSLLQRTRPDQPAIAASAAAPMAPGSAAVLQFDSLLIDPLRRTVQRQAKEVELTSTAFELLLLAREPQRVFTHDEILNRLRGRDADLNALVRAMVGAQCARRGNTQTLDAALPTLALDCSWLQLLVRNLLDNALRHGTGTPVALHIRLADGAVCSGVCERGPGVAPAQLLRLNQAFYRPDQARSRSAGAVGLGLYLYLYLCRLVALSQGGRLDLRHAALSLELSLRLPLRLVGPASAALATS